MLRNLEDFNSFYFISSSCSLFFSCLLNYTHNSYPCHLFYNFSGLYPFSISTQFNIFTFVFPNTVLTYLCLHLYYLIIPFLFLLSLSLSVLHMYFLCYINIFLHCAHGPCFPFPLVFFSLCLFNFYFQIFFFLLPALSSLLPFLICSLSLSQLVQQSWRAAHYFPAQLWNFLHRASRDQTPLDSTGT